MKVALITDTHAGARGDSPIFDSYFHQFYKNVFFPFLRQQNIKRVFHLGDVVDRRKYINFNILNNFRRNFLHPLKEMGISMDVIPGNHDLYYKNTSDVNAVQEILGGWSNVKIHSDPEEIDIDGLKVLLIPWINQDNVDVAMNLINTSNAPYIFGHLEITGFLMHHGFYCENGLDRNIFNRYRAIFSGHFHNKSSEGNIHYLGSTYQMTFGDLGSIKGFHVFDTGTGDLTFVENPNTIFKRVVYDDRGLSLDKVLNQIVPVREYENSIVKVVVNYRSNPYYFDRFIETLQSVNPHEIKVVEDFRLESETSAANEMDQTEDTMTILSRYVDGLDIDHDKERIKTVLRTLYLEATNPES